MKLPSQKKILKEDLKDAPSWINPLIDVVNNFMETVYNALNKNITFTENIASNIATITYKTPSTYPVMEETSILSGLKTKAIGVEVLQIVDKTNYTPAAGPCYVPWVEDNGAILIGTITGLAASKTYTVRLRIT